MFEEFYEMYEPEEQEVVALINRCIGGGYNNSIRSWHRLRFPLQNPLPASPLLLRVPRP